MQVRHIPSLDGMRAISVMLVFAAHAGLEDVVPGGLGVTIFFFLSGFLITTLMRSEFEKNGRVNFRHFWLRRILRIFPPFYLVLGAAVLVSCLLDAPGTLSAGAVGAQALHFTNYWVIGHGYSGQPAGTGVYWSLAVEEHFYLLFPWLFAGLQRLRMTQRQQALSLWGLCAAVLAWRCVLVYALDASVDRTYLASDTRLDSILFGCALAVWGNPVLDRAPLNEARWKFAYVPGALLFLGATLVLRDPGFRETLRYSLQGAALTVIFVAVMRFPGWAPFRLLNLRPVAFLGVLSYSLYLVHYAVIFAVRRAGPGLHPLVQAALALALAIALSWALYLFVEKPCARLRKRLTD
jgi:peptidoglycan/LPS O-acetylase OafA/YrhL